MISNPVEEALKAIKYQDLNKLVTLVPHEVNPSAEIPDKTSELRNLVNAAAVYGSLDCLKHLIKKGADLSPSVKNGYTVVHWAAYAGRLQVLQYLKAISQEKKLVLKATDSTDKTALHIAAARGHLNCVKFLLNCDIDIDKQAEFRWTALHFAVAYGHYDIAKFLIDNGASKKLNDDLGRTAEVLATEYKRTGWNTLFN